LLFHLQATSSQPLRSCSTRPCVSTTALTDTMSVHRSTTSCGDYELMIMMMMVDHELLLMMMMDHELIMMMG